MPFNPSDVPAPLIKAVKQRTLVPLVGAGFSQQASPRFKSWTELLQDLSQGALQSGYLKPPEANQINGLLRSGKYLMAAQHLSMAYPADAYFSRLEKSFGSAGVAPSAAHTALFDLNPPLIMTTNYDRLLENTYAKIHGEAPTVMTYRNSDTMQRAMQSGLFFETRPAIFKLHGSIDDPQSIILTERDYRNLVYGQPGYRMVVSALFLTRTVLMLGFSAEDPELLLTVENHREALKYRNSPDFAFLPVKKDSVLAKRIRDDFGVQVIPYTPTKGRPEVAEFLRLLAKEAKKGKLTSP